jgi:hypothetical protein
MGFCQQAQARDSSRVGELMPMSLPHRTQGEFMNDAREQCAHSCQVRKSLGRAAVSFNDPLDSIHVFDA